MFVMARIKFHVKYLKTQSIPAFNFFLVDKIIQLKNGRAHTCADHSNVLGSLLMK